MDGAKNNGEKDEKTPRSYTEQLFKGIKGVETSVIIDSTVRTVVQ